MSRGYLTIALNRENEDYLKAAYGLALSLKNSQKIVNKLSVLTDRTDNIPEKYFKAFDKVILLPHEDMAADSNWKVENYYQVYDATPYDETITVDADTLFCEDISDWWEKLSTRELVATDKIYTYDFKRILHNVFREDYYVNDIPDCHNGFLYFKKGDFSKKVFDRIKDNVYDWKNVSERNFHRKGVHYSSDSALNIALKELDLVKACTFEEDLPGYIHMKSKLQGFTVADVEKDWRKYVDYYFDDEMHLFINDIKIELPFHYHLRDFLSDELLARFERRVL